jgi:hypothetical protein
MRQGTSRPCLRVLILSGAYDMVYLGSFICAFSTDIKDTQGDTDMKRTRGVGAALLADVLVLPMCLSSPFQASPNQSYHGPRLPGALGLHRRI